MDPSTVTDRIMEPEKGSVSPAGDIFGYGPKIHQSLAPSFTPRLQLKKYLLQPIDTLTPVPQRRYGPIFQMSKHVKGVHRFNEPRIMVRFSSVPMC